MRNSYSKQFEEDMRRLATNSNLDDLLEVAKSKYHYNITKVMLTKYLSRKQIRYKNYKDSMARYMCGKVKIGTERIKPDGMIQVKISPRKWEYKQRYIYEQYYGVKLTSDDYIIFLDQDRTNFDINNLRRISRRESSIVANQDLFFKNPTLTETGIEIAKLMIKTKEMKSNG